MRSYVSAALALLLAVVILPNGAIAAGSSSVTATATSTSGSKTTTVTRTRTRTRTRTSCRPRVQSYAAKIRPIRGASVSGVYGRVTVVSSSDGTSVAYSGSVTGVQRGLNTHKCRAKNGCGVHIHNGFSCRDSAGQGGHYFESPVTADPWVDKRYSSDHKGRATFGDSVKMGTVDLNRRTFVVHAQDGSRIGCGILYRV